MEANVGTSFIIMNQSGILDYGLLTTYLILFRSRTKHAWPHSETNCSASLPRSKDWFLLGLLLLKGKRCSILHCTVLFTSIVCSPSVASESLLHLISSVLSWFFFLIIAHFEDTIHTNMAQHNTWQICTVSHLPGWISWPSAPFSHTHRCYV